MKTQYQNQFQQDGFLVFQGLLSDQELAALRHDTDLAIQKKTPPIQFDQVSSETSAAVSDLYKTFDGKIFRRLDRVIDRGGAFERIVFGPLAVAFAAILPPPVSVCLNRHNMVMLKAPRNPVRVEWHQDAPIWNEGVYEHVSAIIAIDDFRSDNGCLEVVPGSHRLPPLGFGDDHFRAVRARYEELIQGKSIKVDLRAGDAVLFHGMLLHGSEGNLSEYSRRSLTVGCYPGDLRTVSTIRGDRAPQTRVLVPVVSPRADVQGSAREEGAFVEHAAESMPTAHSR